MAERVPARLTPSQGRRFALTVGGAFLIFAAIAYWRGHGTIALGLATLGAALSLAGLLIPTYLGPVERAWMAMAHAISKVTTPIVLGSMYLLVLTPVGILRRAIGGNPLTHERTEQGFWKARPSGARRTGSMRRQF